MSQNENETRLAANQKYRETWLVMENDRKVVEKRISKECGQEALRQIGKILDQQIELAGKLTADELRQIILFQEKEEKEKEIVYRRPYIEGETLAPKIKNGPFKTRDAVELILKIGRIVSSAHAKDIVHGDLKPENIMIAQDSSVCIIDWDTMKINRKIGDAQHVTMTQEESAGTPEYMDPEQCKGLPADKQSDVYALGLILYAMLVGKTPYTGMKPLEILDKKHLEIENIASQYPHLQIDLGLAQAIEDALKKERNFRTRTVSEFLSGIDQCDRDDPPVKPQIPSNREETTSSIPVENPQDKTPKYNFVLIGHSGAGKTVLAAGLYSYAKESFSVEADSPQTRKNADNLKTRLITHQWPDHTARGGSPDFSFFIYKNQKNVASICFPEYAGEDINQPRYCDDYLRNVDAAAILLNPNILEKDDHERIDRISKLKECVRYLSRLPVVPPVAFLVTASDRLETDLKDRKDEFEKYAKEIMVSLNSNNVPAKRFDVSVTGKLEIQSREGGMFKPVSEEVSPINIDAPFIWLLDQLEQQEKKRTMQKCFKTIGIPVIIVVVALFALLGIFMRHKGDANQPGQQTGQKAGATSTGGSSTEQRKPNAPSTTDSAVAIDAFRNKINTSDLSTADKVKNLISEYEKQSDPVKRATESLLAEKINDEFILPQFEKIETKGKKWEDISLSLKTKKTELSSIAAHLERTQKTFENQCRVFQKEIVSAFKSEKAGKDIRDIAYAVQQFCFDEGENQFKADLEEWFFTGSFYKECSKLYDNPYQREESYIMIKEACDAIKNITFKSELAQKWQKWCKDYLIWKRGNSQFDIEFLDLQARVKYSNPEKPYFGFIRISKNDDVLFEFESDGWNTTRFESNYKSFQSKKLPSPKEFELGDYLYLYASIYDENGFPDPLMDEFSIRFYPGIDNPQGLERYGSNSDIRLSLGISPYSQFFTDWKNNNPLPK